MAKNDASSATQNAATIPANQLIVIHPFGNYAKGARIEDANEIASVLEGENAGSCNRIQTGA